MWYLIAFCSPQEADSDVIFGPVVDPPGMKAHVKCCDSRSNRSRDIRLPHFVTDDERTTPAYAGHHIRAKRRKKRLMPFCLIMPADIRAGDIV